MMETYHGYVRTPADAIKLFEACRLGLLPRVQRRLSEKERQSIRSGSVFVWDEREAGMRRWTDGKSWSASRVSGSFLTYREMEGKRGGGFPSGRRGAGKTPDSSGRGSDEDQDDGEPDGYRYKADGLMKQSFSITTSTGQHLHLISYYARPHPGQPDLPHPSTDPTLRHIVPVKGMYPESSLNEAPMPAMTRAPMQQPPYAPPPQHHPPQGYPQQYAQYGAWPPSPVATPPYSHYTVAPPYQPAPLPPPTGQYHPHPQQYIPAPPPHAAYDRPQLPPPGAAPPPRATPPSLPAYSHPSHNSPHLSHHRAPVISESPRSQHLQAQAAAVMIDPRLAATSARNPQGPLPALGGGSTTTPPPRALSQSPPGSSHSNGAMAAASGNKASLSALLHPTPANSEPNSANAGSNSANSSPRTATLNSANGGSGAASNGLNKRGPFNEDAKALDMLNKKFCL